MERSCPSERRLLVIVALLGWKVVLKHFDVLFIVEAFIELIVFLIIYIVKLHLHGLVLIRWRLLKGVMRAFACSVALHSWKLEIDHGRSVILEGLQVAVIYIWHASLLWVYTEWIIINTHCWCQRCKKRARSIFWQAEVPLLDGFAICIWVSSLPSLIEAELELLLSVIFLWLSRYFLGDKTIFGNISYFSLIFVLHFVHHVGD